MLAAIERHTSLIFQPYGVLAFGGRVKSPCALVPLYSTKNLEGVKRNLAGAIRNLAGVICKLAS